MPSSALQHWGGPGPDYSIPAKLPATARVVGGNDSHTLLLLHCDGDDGSVSFFDSSVGGGPKVILPHGSARVRPVPKFGDGAMYCDGSGAYVDVAPSVDFRFPGDFTIDFWVNVLRDSSRPFPFAFWYDVDNYFALQGEYTRGGEASFVLRGVVGRRVEVELFTGYVPAVDQWVHIAICRSGSTLRLFVNGIEVDSTTSAVEFNLTGHTLYLGQSMRWDVPSVIEPLAGYIDEFRITDDARFTGTFAPYTNEYTMEFSTDVSGRSRVLGSFVDDARGIAGVAKHTYSADGRGSSRLHGAFSVDGRGRYATTGSFVGDARGKHGVISLPVQQFLTDAAGFSRVAGVFSGDARGGNKVLVPYLADGRGNARVFDEFAGDARGSATIFRSYVLDGGGGYKILTTPTYQLFYAFGSPPNLSGAPWQTFAALPFVTPAISGAGKHYFVLRRLNQWGLQTQNDETTVIELDGAGSLLQPRPSGATYWQFELAPVPKVAIHAEYAYPLDGVNQADQWLVYAKVGSAPVIGVDSPVVVPMIKADGCAKLNWLSGDYSIGNVIYVKVLTRRTTGLARDSDDVAAKVNTVIAAASVQATKLGVYQGTSRGLVQVG